MRLIKLLSLLTVIFMLTPQSAMARSVPPAPMPVRPALQPAYEMEKMTLEARIEGQKAGCTLSYVIYNPGNSPIEVDFLAPLPEGGTVTGLNLFDGKQEMPGKVYGKDEAWSVYRDIVAQLKDPALLEYAGRDTFRARIFPVPPKGRQTLDLSFDYLLPKQDGQVSFNFPLGGPMTVGRDPQLEVRIIVKDSGGLAGLFSPLQGLDIEHRPGSEAVAVYKSEKTRVPDRIRLYYQLEGAGFGGIVLSHKPDKDDDGFFLFLGEPLLKASEEPKVAKNVVFALDKSGSMSGQKFRQAQQALNFILERLDPQDSFNLVDYNGRVYTWQPELMDMSPDNRKSAQAYVKNLRSGGSTNIDEALKKSFELIGDPTQPNYVIFLTDGQPTVGERNEMKLAQIAQKANPNNSARLFTFGVGHDVNTRLLDRLSGQAGGGSIFVEPGENLEAKISTFFAQLTSPVLTRPTLSSRAPINRLLPEEMPDFFSGGQVVVVGRYPQGGPSVFTLKGRQGEQDESYEFKVDLADGPAADGQFIAGLWAQRRIGELLDQIDMAGGKPEKELVDELVNLSKKYGILTPYTSFLALEEQELSRVSDLSPVAADNLTILQEEVVGASANAQRSFKSKMKAAAPKKMTAPPQWDGGGAAAPKMAETPHWDGGEMAQGIALDMASFDRRVAKAGNQKLSPPRQLAGQTFFHKGGRWQAENMTEDDLKDPKTIKQLSDEYFDLAQKLRPEEMIWLTQNEPVLFKHDGISYLIEPVG